MMYLLVAITLRMAHVWRGATDRERSEVYLTI